MPKLEYLPSQGIEIMNTKNHGLTTQGLTLSHTFSILINLAIVGVSAYLTKHFFDVHYPTQGLEGAKSLCDISSFFNCDAATFSSVSNIFGVPIAFLGLALGTSGLIGSIFPSKHFEETNLSLGFINIVGCAILFIYSLLKLGSLCPFCTLYYILSGINFYLLFKNRTGSFFKPNIKILSLLAIPTILGSVIMIYNGTDLEKQQAALSSSVIDQFYQLPNLGTLQLDSPFKIIASTEKFTDAPIQVAVFSDFQCPFCKVLSQQIGKLARHFKGKINISYYFYPLDNACNPKMTRPMHQFACRAAYVAACSKDFVTTHDEIFEHQEDLSDKWLADLIKKQNTESCVNDPKTKELVQQMITEGDRLAVASTPSMIINGVRIDGSLPTIQLIKLFDEILKRNK